MPKKRKLRVHNKKRNSALLYEFLIRQISSCLVSKNKKGARQAMEISKKYFSKGSALREELDLFKTLLNTSVKSEGSAQRILSEVLKNAQKVNSRTLDAEKSSLIKEINHTFSNKFYKQKISDYTVYASIYTLLTEQRNKKKNLPTVDKIKLKDVVIEHLINKSNVASTKMKLKPAYNNTVFNFVLQRFHKKYENKLTERQKNVLMKYAVYLISEDRKPMDAVIESEVANIKKDLTSIGDISLLRDKDLMKQLRECYSEFNKIDFSEISESNILELLKYVKLLEEVKS